MAGGIRLNRGNVMEIETSSLSDAFFHIRMILGMITSLAVARLLTGVARFVQHPGRDAISILHLGWVAFLLIAVMRFWWFEYALSRIGTLTFAQYAFVGGFAALHFLLATLLFPEDIREYDGFQGYYDAMHSWFFGLLAMLFAVDAIDTWLKGAAYIQATSPGYPYVQIALIAGAILAAFLRYRVWDVAFLSVAVALQFFWIYHLPKMVYPG